MRSLIQIYALMVCFCSLMCFVVALGIGAYDVIEVAAPEFTLHGATALYESYQVAPDPKETRSEAEIAAARAEQHRQTVIFTRHSAIQSLIFVGIVCAIDLMVFGIHWWIARREQKAVAAAVMH
jgi:hypothetical protein